MRRTELERRLAALGWVPTGERSGNRHAVWRHPVHDWPIYVPAEDLVHDSVAGRIQGQAE